MRWLLIAGGSLIAIIAVIVIIGALLPRDHVAAVRARIAASPSTVWDAITDVADQPAWRKDIQRVELLPALNGHTAWREHSRNGAIAMVMDSASPPNRLVTRIADDNLPFGGTWEYVVAADDAGASIVTITERGSVHNPVFRFMSRFVFGHTATMNAYLTALGNKFGTKVVLTTVPVAPDAT